MNYEDDLRRRMFRDPSPHVDELARRTIGCAIEVHRELGPGYLEQMYQLALETELQLQGISYERQVPVGVFYKQLSLGTFRLDLVVEGALLIELKAVESISRVHVAQVVSYLRTTRYELALIMNFNVPVLREGLRRVLPPID